VARHAPGSKVRVEYLRERASRNAEVTLDALRDPEGVGDTDATANGGVPAGPSGLGVEITDVPGQGAVVARVAADGPAAGELAPGDLIVEVNRTPVKSAADVAKQVAAAPARQPLLLKVKHGAQTRFVAIERR
jgi:serine protease Do